MCVHMCVHNWKEVGKKYCVFVRVHAYVCDGVHCRRRLNDTDTVSHHARLICFSVCVFVSKYANVYPMFQVYKAKVCACARCALLCVCVYACSLCMTACCLILSALFTFHPAYLLVSQTSTQPTFTLT